MILMTSAVHHWSCISGGDTLLNSLRNALQIGHLQPVLTLWSVSVYQLKTSLDVFRTPKMNAKIKVVHLYFSRQSTGALPQSNTKDLISSTCLQDSCKFTLCDAVLVILSTHLKRRKNTTIHLCVFSSLHNTENEAISCLGSGDCTLDLINFKKSPSPSNNPASSFKKG